MTPHYAGKGLTWSRLQHSSFAAFSFTQAFAGWRDDDHSGMRGRGPCLHDTTRRHNSDFGVRMTQQTDHTKRPLPQQHQDPSKWPSKGDMQESHDTPAQGAALSGKMADPILDEMKLAAMLTERAGFVGHCAAGFPLNRFDDACQFCGATHADTCRRIAPPSTEREA